MSGANRNRLDLATRLFETVSLISRHPHEYTAKTLSAHFHVSVRTIRRYIHTFETTGIRVESDPSGGYFMSSDVHSLPVPLSDPERMALSVVPGLMHSLLGAGVSPLTNAYLAAVGKISIRVGLPNPVMEVDTASVIADVREFAEPTAVKDSLVVLDLLYAINRSLTVEMEYHSMGADEVRRRRFDPYHLIPWQNALYAVGWCHLRREIRIFKVGRMRSLSVGTMTFRRQPDFQTAQFLQQTWGIDRSGQSVDAVLAFSPAVARYAREELRDRRLLDTWSDTQGRYVVQVHAQLNHEFRRFILQYGADVEVLAPALLRADVVAEIGRQTAQYADCGECQ